MPTGDDVRISLLGPIAVERAGRSLDAGSPKQRAVLAMLAVRAGRTVDRDVLLTGVWGDDVDTGRVRSLHTYISNLRALIGDVVVRVPPGYRLAIPSARVDANRFEQVVETARSTISIDSSGTASSLRDALSWWRGRPFADLHGAPGLEPEVRRLDELRLEAVELRIDAELASGRHEAVLAEVGALAEEHPTRERFRAQHMLALYRSSRQTEALSVYRRTERFLAEEMGLEPSAELQALELAILQHDDSLLVASDRAITQRLAFLVSDIEGSTRLWDRHPQEMAAALAIHDRLMRVAIESAGGRVVKHTGEGVLAVFGDAVRAAEAAAAAQRAMASNDWGEVGEIRVRMGIDVGDAESRGGDFYGPPLTRASRIAAVGHGGQVLVSTSAHTEITAGSGAGVQVRQLGEHRLRGLAAPERIAQLVFVGLPAEFPPLRLAAEPVVDVRINATSLPGYEVRERIGEGAYGVVYRAYQPSVGREVAIKVIRPELAEHPSFVRRFEAEARTIARLAHPHIVPLIDFWRDPQGAYLVLQLLSGGSLVGALEGDDVAAKRRILGHIGDALDYAHSQGIVHGDLKPANVLLDGLSNAYLSDFGILPRLLDPGLAATLSSAPEFQAPELATTGPSPSTDLFAYGVLVSRLLGGTPEIEGVVARACAATPQDRYTTAAELLADLGRALGTPMAEAEWTAVSRNPFKGLRAFEEGDSADFHGRAELVDTLTQAIFEHRFIAVVGPSGSGKSSVVQAGLLPALATNAVEGAGEWFHTVMTPGSHPLVSLAEALSQIVIEPVRPEDLQSVGLDAMVDDNLVLVVDQFEELYTLAEDEEERRRFVDVLVEAIGAPTSQVRVVATLRADFYDRPLEDERLGRLVNDGLVTVLRPTREELVEMITAPAQAVGLRFEPGLGHRIAEDVAHQPGGLPLLQYALTELVERRGADLLTGKDYERIGRVGGALATRAEALYQDLTPAEQEAARQVLLRLVTVDEETYDSRRRVRRSELESMGVLRSQLDNVLHNFTSQRLLLADRDPATRGPTAEVAHEALLREWPRLAGWIEDQREALILGRRFRAALADWDANDRHVDHLLTGRRLAPFADWAETNTLTVEERGYYQRSKEKDDEQRRARRRRRRTLIGVLAGAALASTLLGSLAAVQGSRASAEAARAAAEADAARTAEARAEEEAQRATRQAELAEESARVARARELAAAAEAAIATDPALAKLLALSSIEFAEPTMDTISILRRALAADRVTARHSWPSSIHRMAAIALSPDGSLAAFGGYTTRDPDVDRIEVRDVASWSLLWSNETRGHGVDGLYFSPDSQTLVIGLTTWMDGEFPVGVEVRAATTGELVVSHPVGACGPTVAAVSETHALIQVWPMVDESCTWEGVTEEPPASLELIDLRTGDVDVLAAEALDVRRPTLSGDGRYAAFGLDEHGPRSIVLDVATHERVLDIDPVTIEAGDGFGRALSHDGSLLLSGDRPMVILDVVSGSEVARFDEHGSPAHSAVFTGDASSVWSVGADGNVYQWDPATGRILTALPGAGGSGHLRSSVDGSVVLVDELNGRSMAVIAARSEAELWSVGGCAQSGTAVDDTLAVAVTVAILNVECDEGEALTAVIDVADQTIARQLPGWTSPRVALSPDGQYLARQEAAETGTPLRIRAVQSGDFIIELEGSAGSPAGNIEWSPDGSVLVARTAADAISAWDPSTGALLSVLSVCRRLTDLVFMPDGSGIIVGCFEEPLAVVSTSTWTTVERPEAAVGHNPTFPGYAVGDSTLLVLNAGTGSASMHWLEAATLEIVDSISDVHAGATTAWATSPSSLFAATASSDGFVKIWDLVARRQIDEIFVGRSGARGVAFADEDLLLIAVEDRVMAVTLDVDELATTARRTLTRDFTRAECERYGFGDACPTLEDIATGLEPGSSGG